MGSSARVVRRTLLVGLVVAAATPTLAPAHEATGPVQAVIDEVDVAAAGFRAEIVGAGADRLMLRNDGPDRVEVLDAEGDPVLRLGPTGVHANIGQLSWYEGNDPFGMIDEEGELRTADGTDRWVLVSREPRWTMHDQRVHPRSLIVPERVEVETTVAAWTVPVRVGDDLGAIRGRVVARPVLGVHRPVVRAAPDDERFVVQLVPGAVPGFFLRLVEDVTVVVLGREGEPFLRFSDDGVEANGSSPSWLEHLRLADAGGAEVPADASAPPAWTLVSATPSFTWLDARAAAGTGTVPQEPGLAQVTGSWSVPLLVDGTAARLTGETRWVPADPDSGERAGPPWAGAIGVTTVAVALVSSVVVGRSRARRPR